MENDRGGAVVRQPIHPQSLGPRTRCTCPPHHSPGARGWNGSHRGDRRVSLRPDGRARHPTAGGHPGANSSRLAAPSARASARRLLLFLGRLTLSDPFTPGVGAHPPLPLALFAPQNGASGVPDSLPGGMGSLIKKRRKRMRKKKHKKMLKATRWQRRAGK
jgi:hypothetical protein